MDPLNVMLMGAAELSLLLSIVLCLIALAHFIIAMGMGPERKKDFTDKGNWLSTNGGSLLLGGIIFLGIAFGLAYTHTKLGLAEGVMCQYAPRSLGGVEGLLLPLGAVFLALGIILLVYQEAAKKLVPATLAVTAIGIDALILSWLLPVVAAAC